MLILHFQRPIPNLNLNLAVESEARRRIDANLVGWDDRHNVPPVEGVAVRDLLVDGWRQRRW